MSPSARERVLPILSLLFPLSCQRTVQENWSLTPITDGDNLRHLRCAYRLLVLGESTPNYENCRTQIKEFFAGEETDLADYYPPRGWYHIGCKKEVPRDACCVGCYYSTYVWVTSEGMNGLATFTMGALDLATGKMRTPQKTMVRTYKGEGKPENLTQTQVTTTEDDEEALKAIREGRRQLPPRARITEPAPFNPGLFVLPRP